MCDVVKTFPGVKALNHAQLKLKPGTVHALMGENGAGKSTLMKCMFGIYHMDEGKVIYEGQEVQIKGPLDALNRGIAMVHQELQPIPERVHRREYLRWARIPPEIRTRHRHRP